MNTKIKKLEMQISNINHSNSKLDGQLRKASREVAKIINIIDSNENRIAELYEKLDKLQDEL